MVNSDLFGSSESLQSLDMAAYACNPSMFKMRCEAMAEFPEV